MTVWWAQVESLESRVKELKTRAARMRTLRAEVRHAPLLQLTAS